MKEKKLAIGVPKGASRMEGSWVTGEDNDVVRGETRGRPTQGTVMRISLLGRFSSIIFGPSTWWWTRR